MADEGDRLPEPAALLGGEVREQGEEGRLKEYVFFAGRHWDLVKFALYRSAWEELKARFARLVFIEQELSEQLSDRRLSTAG